MALPLRINPRSKQAISNRAGALTHAHFNPGAFSVMCGEERTLFPTDQHRPQLHNGDPKRSLSKWSSSKTHNPHALFLLEHQTARQSREREREKQKKYFASSNPHPPHSRAYDREHNCVNSSMVFKLLGAYDCSTSFSLKHRFR